MSQGLSFSVKVVPGASKNAIAGPEGEFLKVRLTAPPVDGQANHQLIGYLSEVLSVPRSQIRIQSGFTSRKKVIRVENYDAKRFHERISNLGNRRRSKVSAH
jgi:uncharacterized protein (TIGR00251 family)